MILGIGLVILSFVCFYFVVKDSNRGIDAGGCVPILALCVGVLAFIFGGAMIMAFVIPLGK